MSQTKGVRICERVVWVWDNSHDIVVARMVEAARGVAGIDDAWLEHCRRAASLADHALAIARATDALGIVLARARQAIASHGDVVKRDLVGWSVLAGLDVSDGFLRVERLPVAALVDVVDAFEDLVAGRFAPDPPGRQWFVGAPDGRRSI